MKNLTKCENCGGPLVFSPIKQVVCCEHCDTVYPIDVPKRQFVLTREYSPSFVPDKQENPIKQYLCNNCHSVHIVDAEKQSKRCPSCGSTDIQQTNSDYYCPDGIIPFSLTKEKAVKIFDNWLKKRKFAPNDLHALARNGKVSKVYVPIFNINATNLCNYNGVVKKVHIDNSTNAVFSTVHTVNDVESTEIKNYAYCANSVIDAELINQIVRLDTSKVVPFSYEYLLGYTAVETNKTVHQGLEEIKHIYSTIAENKVRGNLRSKYDEIESLVCSNHLRNITFNYAYTPVFMNHYTYKNKDYHCYIDGTTGKVSGKAPKSIAKIFSIVGISLLAIVGIIAIVAAVV